MYQCDAGEKMNCGVAHSFIPRSVSIRIGKTFLVSFVRTKHERSRSQASEQDRDESNISNRRDANSLPSRLEGVVETH